MSLFLAAVLTFSLAFFLSGAVVFTSGGGELTLGCGPTLTMVAGLAAIGGRGMRAGGGEVGGRVGGKITAVALAPRLRPEVVFVQSSSVLKNNATLYYGKLVVNDSKVNE